MAQTVEFCWTEANKSPIVEFCARTRPSTCTAQTVDACAAETGLSVAVEGNTARTGKSASDDGPLRMRTFRPAFVEAGAVFVTRANPSEEATSGSPRHRISCSSALELRVSEIAPTVNVTVADSSPSILLKTGVLRHLSP